ncbi:ABC transporter permease [Streptomyces carminius]|uniref:Transport permease protein n=1 Tax=Streptomyces carminius TaxID=2665496 RepID=A0A2M8LPU0_9ACTN|nr:ABC transporter permease [Streptomyces carminius]PJE93976.1 ABC transporter permease [Streptomyces carminius]
MTALAHTAYDTRAVLGRHLARARRAPGLLVVTQAMPLALLLFFGYVFGPAVSLPGGADYRAYLVPGLFAVTAAGGLVTGMLQAAQDAGRGVTDRLRTLPISRAAVPAGQAAADVLTTAAGLLPLLLVGYAVGWRPERGPGALAGMLGILLLFRLATVWVGIHLGLVIRDEAAAGQLGSSTFMVQLLSNAYIPTAGMTDWLRAVAEWNPISAVAAACRELSGGEAAAANDVPGAAWPVSHPVVAAVGWSVLLLAVFVPLAVRRHARGADGR